MTTSASILGARRRFGLLAALVLGLAAAPVVRAQTTFPSKPLHIVVGTPAGGPIDALARIVGEVMSASLGQPFIIENKPGASGALSLAYLKQQPADGYTLTITADASFNLNPLVRKVNYQLNEFTFISNLVFAPYVFAVPASLPVKTLKEFVDKAKAEPGRLSYGMMLGTPPHLVVEHLKSAAGIDVLMVPYTGGVPIVNALLTGEVSMTLMNVSLLADWVRQGKLRALATSQTKRLKLLPDVPTMAEAGFGDLHLGEGNSYIVAGPAGMPKPVVDRLHQAFTAALEKPEVRKRLEDLGYELRPQDGTVLKAELQQSLRDNEKAVKTLGIKLID